MIHSLSGGVIRDYGSFTFVKVTFDGSDTPYWFISEFPVEVGDRVSAPFGAAGLGKNATVIKVEDNVSGQVTPVPLKRAKKLIGKIVD